MSASGHIYVYSSPLNVPVFLSLGKGVPCVGGVRDSYIKKMRTQGINLVEWKLEFRLIPYTGPAPTLADIVAAEAGDKLVPNHPVIPGGCYLATDTRPAIAFGGGAGGVADESSSVSSACERQSEVQALFREQVLARDGNQCLLCDCKIKEYLEAVHIINQGCESLAQSYALFTSNDYRNGFTLCTRCRGLFDAYLWCIDAEGKIEMSNAMTHSHPELVESNGKVLKQKRVHPNDAYWPSEDLWAYHREKYLEEAEERVKLSRDCEVSEA